MPPTRDQLEKQIAEIDSQLNDGLSQVNVDGIQASVDLNQLRRQRRVLAARLDKFIAEESGRVSSPFRPVRFD